MTHPTAISYHVWFQEKNMVRKENVKSKEHQSKSLKAHQKM
jgi:hypothetical protein